MNWFRQDADGNFLWPGFGENLRVLSWIIDRCSSRADAVETPIGYLPLPDAIDIEGIGVSTESLTLLLAIDAASWAHEMEEVGDFLATFGDRLPPDLVAEHRRVSAGLNAGEQLKARG